MMSSTGSPSEIAAVEKAFRVSAAVVRTGSGTDDYSIEHSAVPYLMGPNDHFIAALPAEQSGKALAADIERYLS